VIVDNNWLRGSQGLLETFAGLNGDEHGKETPQRFLNMLNELTECKVCDTGCIKWKDFDANSQDMVVVQDIPFSSVCNHHVVPFVGFATIGYVPDRRVAGLSKFARTVRHFARRLQVQENLTYDIGSYLEERLEPLGLAVVTRAEHLCMTIRGAQSPGTYTTVARMTGVFNDHERTAKAEFMTYLGAHK
jgi:GTP cyclohydrolase I